MRRITPLLAAALAAATSALPGLPPMLPRPLGALPALPPMLPRPMWAMPPMPPLFAHPMLPRPPLGPVDYTGMYQNFLGMMFMQPGAVGMGLPLVPSLPMLDGLPGMSVRRAGSYFGPHWDAQVTARSTAAAEALVEPLGLLPQNTEHPSYPPGVPLRFGFSTTYPQVAQAMGGPAGFL